MGPCCGVDTCREGNTSPPDPVDRFFFNVHVYKIIDSWSSTRYANNVLPFSSPSLSSAEKVVYSK